MDEKLSKTKEQLAKGFDTWTSGDVNIDEIIQKSQLEARDYSDILEWIEFSKLEDFKYSALEVYEAYWIDGCISYYLDGIKRMSNTKVVVQYIDNEDLPEVLIQIKKYLMITDKSNFVRLFGFSLNPEKNKYALVIDYVKYELDQYLELNKLDWSEKHIIIRNIITLLKNLHENYINLNYFSPENILVYRKIVKFSMFVSFGPEYYIVYTAPEILQDTGRKNDPSSDIYALGMIFYTIIFEQGPFADTEDKSQLTNKIINGARPQFLQDIPYFLRELILKCWDAYPFNRPTIDELENILLQNSIYEFQYYNFSLNDKQEFQNMSCISERFYKTSLDISNSFQLYSGQLLKSIKSTNNEIFYGFCNCINFYLLKSDKHKFIEFRTDNYENGINIINKNQIIDIQMFGDSCINNISSAKMGNVKIIIKKLKNDENKSLLLKEQLNYWNSICKYHDNIVELLGILMGENKMSLILPYAHEGNLRVYLKNKECSLEEKIAIATNIADGILYIHKDLDIIHETLHPKNILMFGGIAKISDLPLPYDKKKFSYYDKYLFDNIGHIDPNLLLNEKFEKDKSMDIYSLGTILWEIMSEVVPYSKDKSEGILQLVLKIKNGYREKDVGFNYPCSSLVPYGYINIYKKCWNGDSLGRPKIEDIYERLILIQDNIQEMPVEMSVEMSERVVRGFSSGFSGETAHSHFFTDEFIIGISLDSSNTLVGIESENERENENKNGSSEDPSWSEESIALLLTFLVERKREIDQLEKYNNIKTKFWNDAAIMLSKNGHNEYNAEQCSVKWENIKQNYEDNWYKSEVEEILDSTMKNYKDECDLFTAHTREYCQEIFKSSNISNKYSFT